MILIKNKNDNSNNSITATISATVVEISITVDNYYTGEKVRKNGENISYDDIMNMVVMI